MAFDACMMQAVIHEINEFCRDGGARVEKVLMPQSDEVALLLHIGRETRRLSINAGSNAPRMSFTRLVKDNPLTPPMFCMLLRKHLTGAVLTAAEQVGFERVALLRFRARDEMGFVGGRTLVCEIMGKYSNLMLLDDSDRILGVLRAVDFTTSRLRQVLPGMTYELPPPQDKLSPIHEPAEHILSLLQDSDTDRRAEKFITDTYLGISSQNAREIVYRAGGEVGCLLGEVVPQRLAASFTDWFAALSRHRYAPTLVCRADGTPLDYSVFSVSYMGDGSTTERLTDFGTLFDRFFGERDRRERIKLRSADLCHLIHRETARLLRKTDTQRMELAEAEGADKYRKYGDLITSNMYAIKRGDATAHCTDWEDEATSTVSVPLDIRLSPSANAQRYYKLYNKAKTARRILAEQLDKAEQELRYLESLSVFLDCAETEADLAGIREELVSMGYIREQASDKRKKPEKRQPRKLVTPGGYDVYVGSNNIENEYITFKLASRDDMWFHVKGMPGSHVVMCCGTDEPSAEDYTFCATVAAHYSAAEGKGTAVDYTRVRELRRVPGAHAGFVVYHTNYSAYVDPADYEKMVEGTER